MIKDHTGVFPFVGEPTNEGAHCWIKHPHAGGRCGRPAVMSVYDLNYCREHGQECKMGALSEAVHDAEQFFARFANDEVRSLSRVIELGIEDVRSCLVGWDHDEDGYFEALKRAFPNPPAKTREMVERWEADEEPGHAPVVDSLLDFLDTTHKLMRLAYEDRQTMLVEALEEERQSAAGQCSYAMRGWKPGIYSWGTPRAAGKRPGE